MKIRVSFAFLLIIIGTAIHAQNRDEDEGDPLYTPSIMPASPTASELGRYGQIPINLSSGLPNINIPLYTLKTKNLSLPISLSYNCSGIKVDQISSWVGLGWSLNAGGVVTRTVRDAADADDDYEWVAAPDNLFRGTPEVEDYLNRVADDPNLDTEPDLFSFNFNGYSGVFVLDSMLTPVLIPYQNLKIETDYFLNSPNCLKNITITTPEGIKYYFGGDGYEETTRNASTGACGRDNSMPVISSWYLRKIVHPLGDSINFTYVSH